MTEPWAQRRPTPAPHPTNQSQASFPPAWHADPTGRHRMRFWDGGRWSDHVSDGTRTGIDPLQAAVPVTAPPRSETEPRRRPGCLAVLVAAVAALATGAVVVIGTFLVLGLSLQDDPPGWLRFVASGASAAVLFAVLQRGGWKPPGGPSA